MNLAKISAVILLALPLAAANISGKWELTRQGPGRPRAPVILVLNQVGDKLTGSLSPPRGVSTGSPANVDVWAGKVEGDTVSFQLWTGLDKPVKNLYQGKITGDEIVFTVTLDPATDPPANQPRTFQVTAKRVP